MQSELLVVGDPYHARFLSRHPCREGLVHVASLERRHVSKGDGEGTPALSEDEWEPLHCFAERVAERLHQFVMHGLCMRVSLFLPAPLLGETLNRLSDAVTRALAGFVDVGPTEMAFMRYIGPTNP